MNKLRNLFIIGLLWPGLLLVTKVDMPHNQPWRGLYGLAGLLFIAAWLAILVFGTSFLLDLVFALLS
jgi:hypothetical protein